MDQFLCLQHAARLTAFVFAKTSISRHAWMLAPAAGAGSGSDSSSLLASKASMPCGPCMMQCVMRQGDLLSCLQGVADAFWQVAACIGGVCTLVANAPNPDNPAGPCQGEQVCLQLHLLPDQNSTHLFSDMARCGQRLQRLVAGRDRLRLRQQLALLAAGRPRRRRLRCALQTYGDRKLMCTQCSRCLLARQRPWFEQAQGRYAHQSARVCSTHRRRAATQAGYLDGRGAIIC